MHYSRATTQDSLALHEEGVEEELARDHSWIRGDSAALGDLAPGRRGRHVQRHSPREEHTLGGCSKAQPTPSARAIVLGSEAGPALTSLPPPTCGERCDVRTRDRPRTPLTQCECRTQVHPIHSPALSLMPNSCRTLRSTRQLVIAPGSDLRDARSAKVWCGRMVEVFPGAPNNCQAANDFVALQLNAWSASVCSKSERWQRGSRFTRSELKKLAPQSGNDWRKSGNKALERVRAGGCS